MPKNAAKLPPTPPGWDDKTWGYHLGLIAFMDALHQGHFSSSSPAWHVRKYRKALLEDDRRRIVQILRKHKRSNADVELEIYRDGS